MKESRESRNGLASSKLAALVSIAVVSVLGLACASLDPPSSGKARAGHERTEYRIAIAHVTLAKKLERQGPKNLEFYSVAATNIESYLEKALLKRGAVVLRAHNAGGAYPDAPRLPNFHGDASRLARAVLESLNVDALLVVELSRWSPRDMRSRPRSPAAVAFRATLHGGPEGLLLWSGEFSERQVTFFDDPWRAIQYPGRGTRWLTATELAQWGARRLAAQIPNIPARN